MGNCVLTRSPRKNWPCIDISNRIKTDKTNNYTSDYTIRYTATENCWVWVFNTFGQAADIWIDNTYLYPMPLSDGTGYGYTNGFIPLGKGQSIKIYTHSYGSTYMAVYGIKWF